jgi:hypothetical protein
VSDSTPKALAIARQAFAKACTDVDPGEILKGAKVWITAADAPRFLPVLPQWLAAKGWEKPPPTKAKTKIPPRGKFGRRRHADGLPRSAKPDWAPIGAALVAKHEAIEAQRAAERRRS